MRGKTKVRAEYLSQVLAILLIINYLLRLPMHFCIKQFFIPQPLCNEIYFIKTSNISCQGIRWIKKLEILHSLTFRRRCVREINSSLSSISSALISWRYTFPDGKLAQNSHHANVIVLKRSFVAFNVSLTKPR